MSNIIGYEKQFVPHAVVTKDDFPDEFMYITMLVPNKRAISVRFVGKNIYGFFVTNKEFNEKVAQKFCFNGWYDVPVLGYKSGESIPIGVRSPDTVPSKDLTFEELGIPARKIRWWHKKLKWTFKE